jgi:hypothetical protein
MIDEADRDGDGEISEEEFMRIMKKTNLFWAYWSVHLSTMSTSSSYYNRNTSRDFESGWEIIESIIGI